MPSNHRRRELAVGALSGLLGPATRGQRSHLERQRLLGAIEVHGAGNQSGPNRAQRELDTTCWHEGARVRGRTRVGQASLQVSRQTCTRMGDLRRARRRTQRIHGQADARSVRTANSWCRAPRRSASSLGQSAHPQPPASSASKSRGIHVVGSNATQQHTKLLDGRACRLRAQRGALPLGEQAVESVVHVSQRAQSPERQPVGS